MTVRPVIGVPWSADNAALFAEIGENTRFTLTLNTGAVQEFTFASKRPVRRSETAVFRQVAPGLVLLLIGETDQDGLPTATRTLVTATYPPDQELSRGGELIPVGDLPPAINSHPTPTLEPVAVHFADMDVQLVSVTTEPGRLTTVMRIYNGGTTPQTFTPDDIGLTLGYAPNPPGPRVPAEGMTPFTLLPGQAADVTLVWPHHGEPHAILSLNGYTFALGLYPL